MIAYLDAATGSVIVQIFAGGMASAYAYLRYRAGSFRRSEKEQPELIGNENSETAEVA